MTASVQTIGISRQTAYDWRAADPKFAEAWEVAVELGTDSLEDEAIRRARVGTDKPVYQGGELVGHVREFSDTLMIFMLKARRPGKYREDRNFKGEITITLGKLIDESISRSEPAKVIEHAPAAGANGSAEIVRAVVESASEEDDGEHD